MKVTFENATIADAIVKAGRVAPTKSGQAFDKAAGILMSLDPENNKVTLRATNLDIFYLEVVDAMEVEGDGDWRFPSIIITGIMSKLPIGSGKTVTLEQVGGEVVLKSGRITAKLRVIDPTYYSKWDAFDPELLEMVPDLGSRIKQVEWAALDDNEIVYSGIHMNGEFVIATDRIRVAVVECKTDVIYKPITIPAGILKPIMSNLRDVAVGIDEGMFLLMPDSTTQVRTRIYDKDYPNVMIAFERFEFPNEVKIRKNQLLEMIDRAMVFGQSTRAPKLTMIIGKGELAIMVSEADAGLLGETIDVENADHKRKTILFTPKNLTDALSSAPSEEITFKYNIEKDFHPVQVDGGSGYRALVTPRRETEASSDD